ncbi:hypothetical protein Hanom_Chr16g01512051 [Helianthus anomalus]
MNMESQDHDDSAFYEDLTRHILMLMDDDNETHVGSKIQRRSLNYGARGGGLGAFGDYFSWCESGKRFEVPIWMERLWASNAAGTGVFIPRVEAVVAGKSRRRRQNKQRKKNVNDGGRMHSSAGHRIHG